MPRVHRAFALIGLLLLFQDAAAFTAHQQRVAGSEWGRATAGIERRYEIEGI